MGQVPTNLFPAHVNLVSLYILRFQLSRLSGLWHLVFIPWNLVGFITCLKELMELLWSIKNSKNYWIPGIWSGPLMARSWTRTLQCRGDLMHVSQYLMLQQDHQETWSYFSFPSPTPSNVLFLEKIEGSGKMWFIPLMMWSGLILLIYNTKEWL